ncbi:GNAT family N-acetyltransferase [Brevibacterium sp.]|uniref:GNAT family N-acetyltransferase n=1 Tax=Brevibacterium sp. TaxID=1701 RepID=UPI002811FBFA|nr:GNAT family N-acetyltransferase [Brevibacterium sp.]
MLSEATSLEPTALAVRADSLGVSLITADFTWQIWDADVDADCSAWLELWERSPSRNPFAHPQLCRLLAPSGSRLLAATLTDGRGHILYPFCLRQVEADTAAGDGATDRAELHDVVSPYGYGGPVHWDLTDVEESAACFWPLFDAWARLHSVVSEFIRFSLFDDEILPYPGTFRSRQANFVRELDHAPDQMWTGHEFKKVRKNAKRAVREGTSIVFDEQGAFIDDFLEIYIGTMNRRSSSSWYRFDRSFFEEVHRWLAGRFVYVFAQLDGRMVSADLLVLGSDTGYDFLGGTDEGAFSVRPNDLVKVETMRWLHEHGYRRFVIGGGLTPGDTLERYKRGFAPHGEVAFRTGERVLARAEYDRLTTDLFRRQPDAEAATGETGNFFPAYRRPLQRPLPASAPELAEEF